MNNNTVRVLGLDCGTATTGWAVLEKLSINRTNITVQEYGVIKTESRLAMSERLKKLFGEITKIIKMYKPNCVAIESLFFFNNQKTVISVGQARGVLILAAAQQNLPVFDYTPLQVKQAVSGYGKASKVQVQKMVKLILNLDELPKPDDAADALAISICHLNTKRY